MSNTTVEEKSGAALSPVGKVIGFVNTQTECEHITEKLFHRGIGQDRIAVLGGSVDDAEFREMMQGCMWGEEAEQFLKEGNLELANKHFVISVQVNDRDEGLQIATMAQSLGGHGFRHFGLLADERLTH